MKKISVYDPAQCCSTGVCGTEVDPKLVQFASDLAELKKQGVAVERFNLSQQPAAFAANEAVKSALATQGNDCLPLILADGEVVTKGIYPSQEQLQLLAGLPVKKSTCCGGESEATPEEDSSGCCSGDSPKSSCC